MSKVSSPRRHAAVFLGGFLILVEITIGAVLATKDVRPLEPAPPLILTARERSLEPHATQLAVTAQDPDATVTAIEVQWADGHRTQIALACPASDYGGKAVERSVVHRDASPAGARLRAVARSCFGAAPRHAGRWVNATSAGKPPS